MAKFPLNHLKSFKSLVIIFNFSLLIFNLPTPTIAITKTANNQSNVSAEVPATTPLTDTTPPFPPILISPANNSYINNPFVHFIWKQTSDPNSNSVFYTLNLSSSSHLSPLTSHFSPLPFNANLIKDNFHTLATATTFHLLLDKPLSEGNYTWFIVATDASNNQADSTQYHFTLDFTPPSLILLSLDNHKNLNFNPTSSPISLHFDPFLSSHQLIIQTEPNVLVTFTFTNSATTQKTSYSLRCPPTPNPCLLTFNHDLQSTTYNLDISAIDLATNSTTLPLITLTPQLSPSKFHLPSFRFYLPSPTLAQIQSPRRQPAIYLAILLALIIVTLLIYLRNHRWNLSLTLIIPNSKFTLSPLTSHLSLTLSQPSQTLIPISTKIKKLSSSIILLNIRYSIPNTQSPLTLQITTLQSPARHNCEAVGESATRHPSLVTTFSLLPFYRRWKLQFAIRHPLTVNHQNDHNNPGLKTPSNQT